MLEKKLQEELNRYKAINKYGKTMIMEQEAPAADPTALPADPAAPLDPSLGDPAADATAPMGGEAPLGAEDPALPPAGGDAMGGDALNDTMDTTEEVDITDLVNMTKNIKNDLENNKTDNSNVITKMDDVFTKLNDLEGKLAQMDSVMAKIDELGSKIEANKPKTEVQKLEMRSLDSYPFNEKPQEFFAHKQGEMKASGKDEYVLTKDDVINYPADQIKGSFGQEEENEYKF